MPLSSIILIILILIFLGVLPTIFLSKRWVYYPSILASLLLMLIAILLAMGKI
jgi:hypothetical protein